VADSVLREHRETEKHPSCPGVGGSETVEEGVVPVGMVSPVNTKSDFQVLMSPKNHASFATALVDDFSSIVLKTCTVNLNPSTQVTGGASSRLLKQVLDSRR